MKYAEIERAALDDPKWAEHSASHLARYLAAADYIRGRRVLEAGSGSGYGACLMQILRAGEILAVDIDPASVQLAQQRYGDAKLRYIVDDCQELSKVPGPFQVICSFEVLEHMPEPERFLRRAGQLLADDGVLLLSTPDRACLPPLVNGKPRNPHHLHEWYQAEFQAMIAAHFDDVEFRAQVQSAALTTRREAVAALRQGLMWANPLLTFIWRKMPFVPKARRPWKKLAGLAVPSVSDYPVVPLRVAPLYGSPYCHFAICRKPKASIPNS